MFTEVKLVHLVFCNQGLILIVFDVENTEIVRRSWVINPNWNSVVIRSNVYSRNIYVLYVEFTQVSCIFDMNFRMHHVPSYIWYGFDMRIPLGCHVKRKYQDILSFFFYFLLSQKQFFCIFRIFSCLFLVLHVAVLTSFLFKKISHTFYNLKGRLFSFFFR